MISPSRLLLVTGLHHEIYLAGNLLHAGGLEAGGLQPSSSNVGANRNGEVRTGMYVTYCGYSFAFWERASGASTQPTSGAGLEPLWYRERVFT